MHAWIFDLVWYKTWSDIFIWRIVSSLTFCIDFVHISEEKMCTAYWHGARGNSVLVDGYSASHILTKESAATCARFYLMDFWSTSKGRQRDNLFIWKFYVYINEIINERRRWRHRIDRSFGIIGPQLYYFSIDSVGGEKKDTYNYYT